MPVIRRGGAGRRRLPLLLVVAGAAVFCVLAVSGMGQGLVYYRTPTELAGRAADPAHRLRVAGLVLPGSVREDGGMLRFQLTDGVTRVDVVHRGERAPLFRAGQGAVAEGSLGADGLFHSDRLMLKHSDEYRAQAP
uniref:cytochrome c maturation protein CcmE n=1 Tax=Nonomuraea pusilla TaxID=46177 RepID=UPI0006E445F4|nr:cytochrome c maturation protein CcmE [Nonomuraea pusilla]